MSELILVRHGQASFGKKSYDKLSELGIEQARLLSQYWKSEGEQFDHIYAGSLLRQQETAQELLPLVAGNPDSPITHTGLNEYNGDSLIRIHLRDLGKAPDANVEFGGAVSDGDVSSIKEKGTFQKIFEEATAKWIEDKLEPSNNEENFEYWAAFKQRVYNALDEIMETHGGGKRVLLSTSGGVIAIALQRVLQFPDDQVIKTNWMVHNSSVTRIRYGSGKISLMQFNNLPHLNNKIMQQFVTYR